MDVIWLRVAPAMVALLLVPSSVGWSAPSPAFSEDVAPILFAKCAGCHRPDGVAPFSVLTYGDAAPHAADMARAVAARLMPPWKPVAGYGEFQEDRRLT